MPFNENKRVVLDFKGYTFKAKPLATLYLNGSIMKTGHHTSIWVTLLTILETITRIFSSYSYAVKLQLFITYCGSMYTAFLWCDFTKRQHRQFEVAHNNVFQRLMGHDKYFSASGMFVENRTDCFDACIRKLVFGFRERLHISDNSLVETIINSSAWRSSKFLQLWEEYLYWP